MIILFYSSFSECFLKMMDLLTDMRWPSTISTSVLFTTGKTHRHDTPAHSGKTDRSSVNAADAQLRPLPVSRLYNESCEEQLPLQRGPELCCSLDNVPLIRWAASPPLWDIIASFQFHLHQTSRDNATEDMASCQSQT